MSTHYEDLLNGQLPEQSNDFNTLRAIAHANTPPVIAARSYLTPEELYHLDEKRKQFIVDMTGHFRAGGTVGGVSDGYHTYDELYHHRALLFFSICMMHPDLVWKSKQHDDPEFPMFDGMFICGITTPDGQATYHYDLDPYWDMLKFVPELERAPKFDGHTPAQAVERIYHMFLKMAEEKDL